MNRDYAWTLNFDTREKYEIEASWFQLNLLIISNCGGDRKEPHFELLSASGQNRYLHGSQNDPVEI